MGAKRAGIYRCQLRRVSARNATGCSRLARDSGVLLEPEKRADAAHLFELHGDSAARHDAGVPAPAGLVIEIDAVHVEGVADALDLPLVARVARDQDLEVLHRLLFITGSRLNETVLDPNKIRRIHLIGICGTGMASLAAMLRERGFAVTGSDE